MRTGGTPVNDPNTPHLTRSELALLRRHAARYPVTGEDREKAVATVREAMDATDSPRTRLTAVHTLAMLDRVGQATDQLEMERERLDADLADTAALARLTELEQLARTVRPQLAAPVDADRRGGDRGPDATPAAEPLTDADDGAD
jgi:hypothetical protein